MAIFSPGRAMRVSPRLSCARRLSAESRPAVTDDWRGRAEAASLLTAYRAQLAAAGVRPWRTITHMPVSLRRSQRWER